MSTKITNIDWIAIELGKSGAQAWAMHADKPVSHLRRDQSHPRAQAAPETALLHLIKPWLSACPPLAMICGNTGIPGLQVPAHVNRLRPLSLPIKDDRLQAYGVPGLIQSDPPDIMHSDATRIAGFLALNGDWDGVICQPGPQTSWAQVSAGEVVSFQTFLTGDLAQMMLRHLGLDDPAEATGEALWSGEAFAAALDTVLSRPERLALALNALRTGPPVQALTEDIIRARLWGTLIGAELAASRPYWLGQQIAVIGPAGISGYYSQALQSQGAPTATYDADQLTLAGLVLAHQKIASQG